MAFSNTGNSTATSVITSDDATSDIAAATGVAALSFFAGALTSYAQGFLPDSLSSFANSASGWTLVTVLLIWSVRARPVLAAMLGAAAFVLLTVGYSAASAVRGLTYDPTLFSIVGLVVGPFVGIATAWLRERDLRAALATATLSGIALGEAVYGLTVVSQSTSPVYWTLSGLAGLALLGGMVTRRLQGSVDITLALGLTAVVTAGFVLAWG
ncbi:DUF6518 family protein [Kineosporia rhizophila]|uniref:DUF6518 family protein n=1 Tax=Kineosporia rhizophila TaxID=84633 RepID=UPI001E2BCFCE|nr:DUF6518 family protein [Kineosporia rhizophila]MCE0536362.1 DUF6518 family protein [Kineosporia rhizophila]